jgi:organic hydroperoxide reductase OsmC/OhrA
VELEGKTLVIRRIHVRLVLECAPEHRETAERVHGIFAQSCPVYRSIHPQIAVTTAVVFR